MPDSIQIKLDVETQKAHEGLLAVSKSMKDTEEAAKKTDGAVLRFGRSLNNIARGDFAEYVRTAAQWGQAVAEGAARSEAHERAVRSLGSAYDAVAQQTNGAVTAEQALRMQQGLSQSGLRISAEQLGVATRAAREYAIATGTDAAQALDQLSDALRGGEAEGLRRFGVTLESNTTRSQAFSSALQQLSAQQRAMGPSAQTMAESNEALSRSFGELTDMVFGSLAKWVDLQGNINGVTTALREMAQVAQQGGDIWDQLSNLIGGGQAARDNAASTRDLNARLERRQRYNSAIRSARGRIQGADSVEFADADMNLNQGQQEALIRRIESARSLEEVQAIADDSRGIRGDNLAARARVAAASAARRQAEERVTATARTAGGNGGGASYNSSRFDLADQVNALFVLLRESGLGSPTSRRATYASSTRELGDLLGTITGQASGAGYRTLQRRPGEDMATFLARSSQGANDFLTSRRDALQAERQAIRDKQASQAEFEAEAEQARLERERGKSEAQTEADRASAAYQRTQSARGDVATQFGAQFVPAAEATKTAAEQMAEGVKGAFDTMTGAIKSHVAAVIEGRESIGEALRAIAHETLMSLAQEAIGRSLMETAAGIAALTNPITAATAPGHFAAAGVYAAVAGLAGLGAYATNAPTAAASAGAGGSRIPSAASAGATSGGAAGSQSFVINVNGTVMDREGMANAVLGAVNDAIERGGMLRAA